MRATVTIDPDVDVLLERAMRERGASFRQHAHRVARPVGDLTRATALAADLEDLEIAARLAAGR